MNLPTFPFSFPVLDSSLYTYVTFIPIPTVFAILIQHRSKNRRILSRILLLFVIHAITASITMVCSIEKGPLFVVI